MKNNYTTIEQSKKLLNLGVPEDSADMFYDGDNTVVNILKDIFGSAEPTPELLEGVPFSELKQLKKYKNAIPCWSSGQLLKINSKCRSLADHAVGIHLHANEIDELIDYHIKLFENDLLFDFSKLEE